MVFNNATLAYSPATNDNAGIFRLNSLVLGGLTGTVSTSGTLSFAGNGTVNPTIAVNQSGNRVAFSTSGSGKINIETGANLSITGNAVNGLLMNASIIGAGSISIDSALTCPITINGSNLSFTGGVTVNGGYLSVGGNSLGSGTLTLNGGTLKATSVASTATNVVRIGGDVQFGLGKDAGNSLTLSGATMLLGSGSTYKLTVSGTNVTGSGSTANTPVILAGAIGDGGNANGLVVSSTNTGGNILLMNGASSNTYTGTTTVNGVSTTLQLGKTGGAVAIAGNLAVASGTVQLLQANQIADTSAVTVSATGATVAVLDLNGKNQTVGALTIGGSLASSVAIITTGAATTGTLTMGGDYTYVATNSTAGAAISGGGTLNLGMADRTFNVGHVSGAAADTTISTFIDGNSHALNKTGAGILVLNAAGNVNANVTGGELVVNKALTGNVTVGEAAMLSGSGSIAGTVSAVGGIIAPGSNGVSLLSLDNAIFGANSIFAVDIDGAEADLLAINGDLDLSSITDGLALTILNAATETRYTIATYSGSLTGMFNDVSSLVSQGFTVDYSTPNQIDIRAVPEPQTWAMIFGGLGILALRQRIRGCKSA